MTDRNKLSSVYKDVPIYLLPVLEDFIRIVLINVHVYFLLLCEDFRTHLDKGDVMKKSHSKVIQTLPEATTLSERSALQRRRPARQHFVCLLLFFLFGFSGCLS